MKTAATRIFFGVILCGIIALLCYNQQLVQNVGTQPHSIDKPFRQRLELSMERDLCHSPTIKLQNLPVNPKCACVYKEKTYSFCYTDPQNISSLGKKFNCSYAKVLEDLNLLNTPVNLIALKESIKNQSNVVFISAATNDHFIYTLKSFETIQKYYPNHKYVFYGLALDQYYMDQIPKHPNFEFRKFNTTPYPKFVNNFHRYHFKGLVLTEALRDFPVVFWIDAHQIIKKQGMLESLFRNISESRLTDGFSSITSFVPSPHSNFAVLHQDLLKFFPSNSIDLLKKEEQVGSGIIFVPRTRETMDILKWWVLCSLTDECINPAGARLACNFDKDQYKIYANCFRFDQSVLNLLLLNKYQNFNNYFIRSMVEYFY